MITICCNGAVFPAIEAVIFDKDGTLANSEAFLSRLVEARVNQLESQVPGIRDRLLPTFGMTGQVLDPAGLQAVGSRQDNEIAAAACIAVTGKGWTEARSIAAIAFAEADRHLSLHKAMHTPLLEGVRDIVEQLASYSVKLAILSSDTTQNVVDFAQFYGLAPYFQLMRGADQPPGKTDPSVISHIGQALKVRPEAMLMVGDSDLDRRLAYTAGMAGCIVVSWGWTMEVKLSEAGANEAGAIARHYSDIQIKIPSAH